MADPLEKQVRDELKKSSSKQQVFNKLVTLKNREDLVWSLNQFPTGRGRKQNLWVNWLLITVLLAVTLNTLYFIATIQLRALTADRFSPMLLLDLIVPAINFFVLSKIVRFQRQSYQFMAVLGVLALFRPENRYMPNLALYLVIIGLSVFLLLRLFPKQERIED